MKCQKIIEVLEELAPLKYALEWDNPGLLAGRREKDIKSVYIALDADDSAVFSAVEKGADMLITHHPLIFRPLKKINSDDFRGRRLLKLIRNDICCYSMHTNFDVAGMSDAAAEILGLRDTVVLDPVFKEGEEVNGIGKSGRLPRIMSLKECGEYVRERFNTEHVRIYGDPESNVEFAAVCPGSGKSEIQNAIKSKAEVFITGDIEYHEGTDALAGGLSVIDAGHYGIEKLFMDYIRDYILENCEGLEIFTHPVQEPFFII